MRVQQAHCPHHGAFTSVWIGAQQRWSGCPMCCTAPTPQQPQRPAGVLHTLGDNIGWARYEKAQLAALQPDSAPQVQLYQRLQRYVQRFEAVAERGVWTLLAGGWGAGKTHALAALATALQQHGNTVALGRASDVIGMMLRRNDPSAAALLQQADVVLVDECSAQTCEHGAFFEAMDARYMARKPVVFAGNAPVLRDSDEQIANFVLGPRLADRLRDGGGPVLRMGWPSLRGQQAQPPIF